METRKNKIVETVVSCVVVFFDMVDADVVVFYPVVQT